jgi:hypothetical protein
VGSPGSSPIGTCKTLAAGCRWVVVTLSNFPGGNHSVTCWADDPPAGQYYQYTTSLSQSAVCLYGFHGFHVWAVVDGVESPHITWP